MKERLSEQYLRFSDEWLVERYFRFGNVEDALCATDESVPFSFADYHRRLEQAGIVKSAGRQTSLTEALHFFRLKQMEPGMPLEKIYKSMPTSFQTSMMTLHRIYGRMKVIKGQAVASRQATALLISREDSPELLLVGQECFTNSEYGKIAGIWTVPMTFSHKKDTPVQKIVRVLQQEVFLKDAIEKRFKNPDYVLPLLQHVTGPFLTYRLLDVEISCFRLVLPHSYDRFSSYKLTKHSFVETADLLHSAEGEYRVGVRDIVHGFIEQSTHPLSFIPEVISELNRSIVAAPSQKQA